MEEQNHIQNPWKGLQSYQETDIIYGRDEEIKALYTKILYNTQTVVYGKSGIGKSSIINAGIVPRAKLDDMLPISIRLAHTSSKENKPSLPYVEQIKQRIFEELKNQGGEEPEEVVPHNPEHQETLWELLHRYRFWLGHGENKKQVTPLLLLDQFEEIFSLETDSKRVSAFFAELADLLNEIMPEYLSTSHSNETESPNQLEAGQERQKNVFSRIAKNNALEHPKYIEKSNFHIVFILREDFLSYLERSTAYIPIMKSNRYALLPLNEEQAADIIMLPQKRLVSKSVAELIIQKVAGRTDFKIDGIPEIEVDAAILSLYLSRLYSKKRDDENEITKELVTKFSDDIINDFYEESIFGIPNVIVEKIEDELLTSDNRRNNVSRKDLVKIGIPDAILTTLVDEKKLLRQFNYRGDNRVEFIHDILCKVVENRIEQRQITAQKKKQEKELQLLRERNKRYTSLIAALLILLSLFGFIFWDGLYHNIEYHYGIVIKKNGWFEGLEKLSESEASYRNHHFVLKKHGRWAKHPYAMEVRDGYGKLTTNHNIGTYILNQYDDTDQGADKKMVEKLKTVCQWEFICNQGSDFVVQERALDEKGNLVVTYNRSQTSDPYKVISSYSDDYGFPLMLRDSTYFYIRTTYDERGFETLMEFFDDQGMPITSEAGNYQTKMSYSDNGINSSCYSCFFDGRRIIDNSGRCGWYVNKYTDDGLHEEEIIFVDENFMPIRSTKDSIIIRRARYDEHNRLLEYSFWNENGKPDVNSEDVHAICYSYNRHGQTTKVYYLDSTMRECKTSEDLIEICFQYDSYGNRILEENKYSDQTVIYRNEFLEDKTCIKTEYYTVMMKDTINTYDKPNCDTTYYYRFYSDKEKKEELYMYDDYCIRKNQDSIGNITRWAYFDSSNSNPIEINGFHEQRLEYEYFDHQLNYTSTYYNLHGLPTHPDSSAVALQKVRIDSTSKTISIVSYDKNNRYLTGWQSSYDDDSFSHAITEESINENWKTVRTYKNDLFYYKIRFLYSIKPSLSNKNIGFYAIGELDAPSLVYDNSVTRYIKENPNSWLLNQFDYTRSNDLSVSDNDDVSNDIYSLEIIDLFIPPTIYYAYYNRNNTGLYFNEHGEIINPENDDWKQLPYIEVIKSDSTLGFCDGDIVLACDDWIYQIDGNNCLSKTSTRLWGEPIDRKFTVARINEQGTCYEKAIVIVPSEIKNIDQYVRFKRMRCTSAELLNIKPIVLLVSHEMDSLNNCQ